MKSQYSVDRKYGYVYRSRRGCSVAQIVPHNDRGKDFEYELLLEILAIILEDKNLIDKILRDDRLTSLVL